MLFPWGSFGGMEWWYRTVTVDDSVQGFAQCKRGARSGKKKGKKGEKEKKGRKKRFNIDTTFT